MVLYRLSNTLDAMWGYRSEKYEYFGKFSARMDDVLNWIPARLTALTYVAMGQSLKAWLCWQRQARTWYSSNAGTVMSSGAGALDVQLGGTARYQGKDKVRPHLGTERLAGVDDIEAAWDLVFRSLLLWAILATLIGGRAINRSALIQPMIQPIKHGGNLREAAQRYQIPLRDWIDLSTGINPNGWQPPPVPAHVWQRLPEENDGLLEAARTYYGQPHLLALAGSQAAIQSLPYCRAPARVGIVSPAYAEYEYCWRKAGHAVIMLGRDEVAAYLDSLDVLIVINPNNPDTYLHRCETLLAWQQQLARRGGWLIVDEAFMDSTPEDSLLQNDLEPCPNLIVLRSLGKFFGLAGLRLGFLIAPACTVKAG